MNFTDDLQQGLTPYRQKLNTVLSFLREFAKNPVQGMRQPPDWEWPVLLIFHAAFAAVCGALSGLISFKVAQFFSGLIVYPISTALMIAAATGFFYYTFLFLFQREMPIKKVATLVILANLPNTALYILSGYLPPVTLFGLFVTCLLLIVGLSEHSGVERKKIAQIVGGIFAIFLAFWVINTISSSREKKTIKDLTVPGSLDILEKEMRDSE